MKINLHICSYLGEEKERDEKEENKKVDVYNYHLEGGDGYPEQARFFKYKVT